MPPVRPSAVVYHRRPARRAVRYGLASNRRYLIRTIELASSRTRPADIGSLVDFMSTTSDV